jgi:hypothetical protein
MCNFITLIAPTKDVSALKEIMQSHGRNATPIENPSIREVLDSDEYQYLTTSGHCDCGTVLYDDDTTLEDEKEYEEKRIKKEITRMKRKKWSDKKIERVLKDQSKARSQKSNTGPDSFELWDSILLDLKKKLNLPYVGLFVRLYSGSITTENLTASRRRVAKSVETQTALMSMKSNEVTIFY